MSGAPRGCSGQLGNQGFRCWPGGADLCIYGQKSQKDALGTHGNCPVRSPQGWLPPARPHSPELGCQGVFWSLPVGKPIPSGLQVSAPPSPHLLCLLQCFLSCAWALLIMCWPSSAEVSPAPQVLAQAPHRLVSHFSGPSHGFFLTSLKY